MAKKAADKLRKTVRGKPFAKGDDPRRGKGPEPAANVLRELARQVLAEKDRGGIEYGLAILRKMVTKATAGDVKAAQLVFDRAYGKPPQPLVGGDEDGGPLEITVRHVKG